MSSLIKCKTAFRYGDSFLTGGLEYQYSLALVMFDNSLEIMISASLYKLKDFPGYKNPGNREFMSLAKRLNKKFRDDPLLDEEELQRLHDARNSAQHRNVTPSKIDLEHYKAIAQVTLHNICQRVFFIDFDEISQSVLVKNRLVRSLYKAAEEDYFKQKYEDCVIRCGAAFQIARQNEIFRLYGNFRSLAEIDFNLTKLNAGKELLKVYEILEKMSEELQILELGLDYKKYQIFNELFGYKINDWTIEFGLSETESSQKAYNSMKNFYHVTRGNTNVEHNREKAEFCLLFVIDPILRWESIPRESITDIISKILQAFMDVPKSDKKEN